MATGRGTYRSLVAWGLAGVPILATLVQTTLALLETTLGSAGLGGIQNAIRSIAVFDAAAVLMWQSPAVLGILFILIAAAWMTQGVAQFSRDNRDVTFAAAGLESVLFFALFLGVYSSMFDMEIPIVQIATFFAVPFLASGASLGSAYYHNWDEKVVKEKSAELAAVSSILDSKRESFDECYRQRVGDLDRLTDIAPTGVERARKHRQEFREQCDDIKAEIELTRGKPPEQLRAETALLQSRVEQLDPKGEVDRIDEVLRDRLASGVRTTYGTIQYWSRYDREYELVNLPGRFREIELSPFNVSVHLNHVDDTLLDRIERGVALGELSDAVVEIDAHVKHIEEYIAEREEAFAETAEAAESDMETVKSKIERFDGQVGERLSELAVEGRHDDLPSVRSVRSELDAVKDDLHDCRFDDAERRAESAAADASEVVTFAEFVWSVVGTVDHNGGRVSLPASVDEAVVAELRPAFERDYDVKFRVESGTVQLSYPNAAAVASGNGDTAARGAPADEENETGADDGRADRARPEEIIDSVLFVLRELKNAGRETDADRAELQTDGLPESVATPAVLTQLERFGRRQTDVVEQLDVQEDAPPGFVELVPKDGTSTDRAIDAIHERYREQYR